MTDANPTPPTPEPVTPPAAPAYAAAPAGPKQTLSLVSFIVGIGSIVFSAAPILPIAAGIVAIIFARRGRASEPGAPKWMTQLGLIFGIIGLILGLLFGFLFYILPFILLAAAGVSGVNSY